MSTSRIVLFRAFGIPIGIELSWVVIAILIVWSFAVSVFPAAAPGLSRGAYLVMGVFGAGLFFTSVVLHELAHAIVALRYGVRIRSITLFLFGGVAEMEDEPLSARTELWIALAGPFMSLALSALCLALASLGEALSLPVAGSAVLRHLGWLNGALAFFNLIPAFPLDGGRVLRAALWARRGNLASATRTTAFGGAVFGAVLIGFGVLSAIGGNLFGGLWMGMLGLFLRAAARGSYEALVTKQVLVGVPVAALMQRHVATVPPHLSLADLVEDHIYRLHFKTFPVVEEGSLLGLVDTQAVKGVPRERWARTAVRNVLVPLSDENIIHEDRDAHEALAKMQRTGQSRLLVVDDAEALAGILALKDLLSFLSLKLELEAADGR